MKINSKEEILKNIKNLKKMLDKNSDNMILKTLKCMKNNIYNIWNKNLVGLKEDQKLNMT